MVLSPADGSDGDGGGAGGLAAIKELRKIAKELLKSENPLKIVENEIIPALNRVGEGFEKKTVYLPGLLMSAEAAKAAFEVIKEGYCGYEYRYEGEGSSGEGSYVTDNATYTLYDTGFLKIKAYTRYANIKQITSNVYETTYYSIFTF